MIVLPGFFALASSRLLGGFVEGGFESDERGLLSGVAGRATVVARSQASGRTTSTAAEGVFRTTWSATEPMTARPRPERPLEAMTTKSQA